MNAAAAEHEPRAARRAAAAAAAAAAGAAARAARAAGAAAADAAAGRGGGRRQCERGARRRAAARRARRAAAAAGGARAVAAAAAAAAAAAGAAGARRRAARARQRDGGRRRRRQRQRRQARRLERDEWDEANATKANATAAAAAAAAAAQAQLASVVAAAAPATLSRNDPSNIFNALTKRMGELEVNQTLINQWLTLWRSQIGAKVKTLNASQENVTKLLRAVQANVSAAAAAVDALTSTHGPSAVESYETVVAENERISATVSALEGRLLTQLADAQRHNARLEAELSMASLHHRLELLCCLLLSVSISLVLVALCGAAVRARSATDPGRESPPTPVVHRRAAFAPEPRARRASVDVGAVQHRERLIAAARAELSGGDAPGFARGTSAFAGGDTDELDDAEVPIGAVARTLEPAPWQEGAERRSSAKKAAIPDSRSMPALPRLGRPGSVPPGRSSAPIHAGDSPDSD